jgi:hypothetical protein
MERNTVSARKEPPPDADRRQEPRRRRIQVAPDTEHALTDCAHCAADRHALLDPIARDDFIVAVHLYQRGWHNAAILWGKRERTHAESVIAMSADHDFRFGRYHLRPTFKADMARAVKWTAADPDHAKRTRPEFWLEQSISRDSYMLDDPEGPLFFFKIHRLTLKAVELHIQFPPEDSQKQKMRVQHGLIEGFAWLEGMFKAAKINDVSFESTSPPLIRFAVKRLGFTQDGLSRLHKEL